MADFDWTKFGLDHWWKAMTAAGTALAVAGVAAKCPPAILLGLGLLLGGLGEWHEHPERTVPGESYGFPFGTVTIHERRVSPLGLALDVAGGLLFVVGLVKLLAA